MQQGEEDQRLHQIWKAYRTTMAMLKDRGFQILSDWITISKDDLQRRLKQSQTQDNDAQGQDNAYNLNHKYTKPLTEEDEKELEALRKEGDNEGLEHMKSCKEREKSIFVYWAVDYEKVTSDMIKSIYDIGMTINCQKALLILNDQTTIAKRLENTAPKDSNLKIGIEKFGLEDLQVNITKHEMVPMHSVLTQHEKEILMEKYMIKESQLPLIQQEDPIARYFGVQRGDIMKITRRSPTSGKYITYRCVI